MKILLHFLSEMAPSNQKYMRSSNAPTINKNNNKVITTREKLKNIFLKVTIK